MEIQLRRVFVHVVSLLFVVNNPYKQPPAYFTRPYSSSTIKRYMFTACPRNPAARVMLSDWQFVRPREMDIPTPHPFCIRTVDEYVVAKVTPRQKVKRLRFRLVTLHRLLARLPKGEASRSSGQRGFLLPEISPHSRHVHARGQRVVSCRYIAPWLYILLFCESIYGRIYAKTEFLWLFL